MESFQSGRLLENIIIHNKFSEYFTTFTTCAEKGHKLVGLIVD